MRETTAERIPFIETLESIIGYPYIWGGEDPRRGFDCSGAVRYCWLQAGYKMEHDMTAWRMCNDFWKGCSIPHDQALPGDLRFYGPTKSAVNHVMIVFRRWPNGNLILAGARGGDAGTIHPDIAYKNWALVDICSETYWKRNLQYTIDPFLKEDREPEMPEIIQALHIAREDKVKLAQAEAAR